MVRTSIGFTSLFASAMLGCASSHPVVDDAARRQMLTLLMPSRIKIVQPFTRIKSFDADATPDGIELLLQAVNSLDNPGLMIAGHVRIELYEYVKASGDQKGRRLESWNVDLTDEQHQRTYWNQLTQMYEFRVGVDPATVRPADRYVLVVTYDSPLGERLTDEYVIRSPQAGGPMGGSSDG